MNPGKAEGKVVQALNRGKAASPVEATTSIGGGKKPALLGAVGRQNTETNVSFISGSTAKKFGKTWTKKTHASAFLKDRGDRGDTAASLRLIDASGAVVLEAPARPARLTPIRQLLEDTPASPGNAMEQPVNSDAGSGAVVEQRWASKTTEGIGRSQRTFSRDCGRVVSDQSAVDTFDAKRSCLECEFFKPCCRAFVRELITAAGKPLWQGEFFDSGAVLYSEGETSASLYIVSRGVAESYVKVTDPAAPPGQAKDKKTYTVGEYFGAANVLGILSRRHETVRAKTSLHVLVVSQVALSRLLKRTKEEEARLSLLMSPPIVPDEFAACESNYPLPATPSTAPSSAPGGSRPVPAAPCSAPNTASENCRPLSKFSGSDVYVFHEERKHFEREAVRLYLELGVQARRKKKSAFGELSAAARKQRQLSADSADAEAATESELHRPPEPPQKRNVKDLWGRVSAIAPEAKLITDETPDQQVAVTPAGERFMLRLVNSIRADMRRGYMMPADTSINDDKRRTGRKPAGGHRQKPKHGTADPVDERTAQESQQANMRPRQPTAGNRVLEGDAIAEDKITEQLSVTTDEESVKTDATAPLDLHLLPPLSLMSPVQKYALLRQLQDQARLAKNKRKAAAKARLSQALQQRQSLLKAVRATQGAADTGKSPTSRIEGMGTDRMSASGDADFFDIDRIDSIEDSMGLFDVEDDSEVPRSWSKPTGMRSVSFNNELDDPMRDSSDSSSAAV